VIYFLSLLVAAHSLLYFNPMPTSMVLCAVARAGLPGLSLPPRNQMKVQLGLLFFRNNSTPLIKVVVCTSRPCPLYYHVSLRAPTLRNSTTAPRVPKLLGKPPPPQCREAISSMAAVKSSLRSILLLIRVPCALIFSSSGMHCNVRASCIDHRRGQQAPGGTRRPSLLRHRVDRFLLLSLALEETWIS
jgi:hypothetical protein